MIQRYPYYGLSIDKISVTCNDADRTKVKDTCDRLLRTANSGYDGFRIKPGKRHHLHCTLPINHPKNILSIEAGPRHSDVSDYRIDLNPAKLGRAGMDQVRSFIDDHFPCGANHLFAKGKITRIDIALDLPGLCLDQVVARSSGSRKHGLYTSQAGDIESTYLGSVRSNRTVIYSKTSEDETSFLRLERRMKPSKLSILRGCDLHTMSNPFDNVQMVAIESLLPYLQGVNSDHFHDSIRLRGLTHVLAKLPLSQSRRIKDAFRDPANSLMPSIEAVWAGWPDLLARSGLLALCISPDADQQAAE